MFIAVLTYTAPLTEIDAALPEHLEWLDAMYARGVLIASGRQQPRTGGVLLAEGISRDEFEALLATDPFQRKALAEVNLIEFVPSRQRAGLNFSA